MTIFNVTAAAALEPNAKMAQTAGPQAANIEDIQSDDDIRQAAMDFETAFVAQMLKFSGLGDALVKGGGEDVAAFTDFYIERFAEKITQNGFGLADKFYEKLKLKAAQTASDTSSTVHVDL